MSEDKNSVSFFSSHNTIPDMKCSPNSSDEEDGHSTAASAAPAATAATAVPAIAAATTAPSANAPMTLMMMQMREDRLVRAEEKEIRKNDQNERIKDRRVMVELIGTVAGRYFGKKSKKEAKAKRRKKKRKRKRKRSKRLGVEESSSGSSSSCLENGVKGMIKPVNPIRIELKENPHAVKSIRQVDINSDSDDGTDQLNPLSLVAMYTSDSDS